MLVRDFLARENMSARIWDNCSLVVAARTVGRERGKSTRDSVWMLSEFSFDILFFGGAGESWLGFVLIIITFNSQRA
jgi:hypothetical protein